MEDLLFDALRLGLPLYPTTISLRAIGAKYMFQGALVTLPVLFHNARRSDHAEILHRPNRAPGRCSNIVRGHVADYIDTTWFGMWDRALLVGFPLLDGHILRVCHVLNICREHTHLQTIQLSKTSYNYFSLPKTREKGKGELLWTKEKRGERETKGAIGTVDTLLRVPSVAVMLFTLKIGVSFAHRICFFTG